MKVVFIKHGEITQSPKGHWKLLIHTFRKQGEPGTQARVGEAKERMDHSFSDTGVPTGERETVSYRGVWFRLCICSITCFSESQGLCEF